MPSGGRSGEPSVQFDAGSDPDRNTVSPGAICERLATIQCAAEVACCSSPGRTVATCESAVMTSCANDAMVDTIAANSASAFDAARAKDVLDEFERLSSTCDPQIKAYAQSFQGLFSIFRGTVAPGGSCQPANILDPAMAAVALASCTNVEDNACLPSLLGPWTCAQHARMGGPCFTSFNCVTELFCDNPMLDIAGSTCMRRKPIGSACAHSDQCESLFCKSGACVAATPEVAYCPER